MGGGASSQAAFEQMLACTMILGEAMVQGLDPRYVRFPDMYRLYDFHIGPKKHKERDFKGGNLVLFVHQADNSFQQIQLIDSDDEERSKKKETESTPEEDDDTMVVYVSGDKIVLDRKTLNQPNNDGWTPLHACCHTLNAQEAGIAILQELIKRNENLNMITKRGPNSFSCGWTPLHIAVAYGLEALALKLIRAGADVNTKNSVGWTPLYDACHRGYASVARELLKAGAQHDIICPEFALCPFPGQFPLAEAARQGHQETVKVLLEWGVDKNAINKLGWTALHEAAYHGRVQIVQMLVVYGADVLLKTAKGSLAKDLTISGEIKSMLEDLTAAAMHSASSSSPKKAELIQEEEDAKDSSSSPKKLSNKTKQDGPLSRKEEYALLGDLPALTAPSISIKNVDDEEEEEAKHEIEAKDAEDEDLKLKKKTRKSKKRSSDQIPSEFKCAISLKLMKDPMRSPFNHVFDRQAIEAWFRDFGNRCPLTGEPLTMHQLTLDEKLKQEIREWKRGAQKKPPTAEEPEEAPAKTTSAPSLMTAPVPEDDPYDF